MDASELAQRIRGGENLHTEFKAGVGNPNDLACEIVAFANTDGGQLVVGVSDDGDVVGVPDPDVAARAVDNVAYNNCRPPITVVQEVVWMEGRLPVLVVNVPRGDDRPYSTSRGVYYVRTSSGRRQASREELLRLFQATESVYYDETLVFRAAYEDIDLHTFDSFLHRAYGRGLEDWGIDPENLLSNLRLYRSGHPTVAGLLFFGLNPQLYIPQAHVVAARIPGFTLAASPADQKTLTGPLLSVYEDAARFLGIHLRVAHKIDGFGPETRPELPEAALREAIVNALAHRDYTIQAPVRVFVFDDRVEVRTPGRLPNTVTVAAMKLGAAHVLRNPTIYTLLSRAGLVTGIGSGVFRMIQLVRDAVGREPELGEEEAEFVVRIPRPASR